MSLGLKWATGEHMNARKVQRASGGGGVWCGGGTEHAEEARQVPVCGKFSIAPHQGKPRSRWPLFRGSSLLCVRILQDFACLQGF